MRVSEGKRTIRIVFIGNNWVIDTRHYLTGDDLDDYAIGCQACMDSSGPHYRPDRMYSDEVLDEVKGLSDAIVVPGRAVRLLAPID